MHYQLEKPDFHKILSLLEPMPPDPMMYTVIEGHQAGQVLVDHREQPAAALVWGGMEYAYFCGPKALELITSLQPYIEDTILPALQETGFVSVFSHDQATRQALLDCFAHRAPTSYGLDSYTFDVDKFQEQAAALSPLPDGYTLVKLDRETLARPAHTAAREDLAYCWESIECFLELGLGYAVLWEGKPVCSGYTIGVGASATQIAICTSPEHRRKGLARQTAAALIGAALVKGRTVYWQNDSPNSASRKLAESLGYTFSGVLFPVDIPVEPGPFHCGLAGHFAGYLKDDTEAEKLYRIALRFNPEDKNALNGLADLQTKQKEA